MNQFLFQNEIFNLNTKVLLKYKRIIYLFEVNTIYNACTINNISSQLVKFKCIDDKCSKKYIIRDIEKKIGFLKKYAICDTVQHIKCKRFNYKHIMYSFKCDFCNTIHKHDKLGYNKSKCISDYSYYSKMGYYLIDNPNIKNFNEYLLYNFRLYLEKKLIQSIHYYLTYINKFSKGSIVDGYGLEVFPFINEKHIERICVIHSDYKYIRQLKASLNNFITMIKKKDLLYTSDEYKEDVIVLYEFVANGKLVNKTDKIIELDLNCGNDTIEMLDRIHKQNIKNLIKEYNKLKLFYNYIEDDEDINMWLCIEKYIDNEKKTIYIVDEACENDNEFIQYQNSI